MAKLNNFDRILSVEACGRGLDAISAHPAPGPYGEFDTLSRTDGVKLLAARMTSRVEYGEQDFDATEPLHAGAAAATVKLTNQVLTARPRPKRYARACLEKVGDVEKR